MFCHNCGKQIPDATKFCHYCGALQDAAQDAAAAQAVPPPQPGACQPAAPAPASPAPSSTPQPAPAQPPYTPPARSKKLPVWGRLMILAVVVLLGIGAGRLMASSYNTPNSSRTGGTPDSGHAEEISNSGMLGELYVEIRSAEKYVNANGESVLIVSFGIINHGDTDHGFGGYVFYSVTQDGEKLKQSGLSFIADDEILRQLYGDMKRPDHIIKPGASVELKLPFILKNTSSDVQVEVHYFDGYTAETAAIEATFMF